MKVHEHQAEQNLAGVEGYRHDRFGTNCAALKPALRKLYGHQPIQHPFGSLARGFISPKSHVCQHGWYDVSCGLRIGRAPASKQAIKL
jgi:hypothetical protein